MSSIDAFCQPLGISIIPTRVRRGARQTHARQVLRRLVAQHGSGHVIFVLRVIVESEGNAGELWSETILAISDVVRARPDLEARGLAFIETFDSIRLGELRAAAVSMRLGPTRAVLAVLLMREIEARLAERSEAYPILDTPPDDLHPCHADAGRPRLREVGL